MNYAPDGQPSTRQVVKEVVVSSEELQHAAANIWKSSAKNKTSHIRWLITMFLPALVKSVEPQFKAHGVKLQDLTYEQAKATAQTVCLAWPGLTEAPVGTTDLTTLDISACDFQDLCTLAVHHAAQMSLEASNWRCVIGLAVMLVFATCLAGIAPTLLLGYAPSALSVLLLSLILGLAMAAIFIAGQAGPGGPFDDDRLDSTCQTSKRYFGSSLSHLDSIMLENGEEEIGQDGHVQSSCKSSSRKMVQRLKMIHSICASSSPATESRLKEAYQQLQGDELDQLLADATLAGTNDSGEEDAGVAATRDTFGAVDTDPVQDQGALEDCHPADPVAVMHMGSASQPDAGHGRMHSQPADDNDDDAMAHQPTGEDDAIERQPAVGGDTMASQPADEEDEEAMASQLAGDDDEAMASQPAVGGDTMASSSPADGLIPSSVDTLIAGQGAEATEWAGAESIDQWAAGTKEEGDHKGEHSVNLGDQVAGTALTASSVALVSDEVSRTSEGPELRRSSAPSLMQCFFAAGGRAAGSGRGRRSMQSIYNGLEFQAALLACDEDDNEATAACSAGVAGEVACHGATAAPHGEVGSPVARPEQLRGSQADALASVVICLCPEKLSRLGMAVTADEGDMPGLGAI